MGLDLVVLAKPLAGHEVEVADDWVAGILANGGFRDPAIQTVEQALAYMQGFYVLELLPECDGLPIYTHGGLGALVDLTSFRGKFVGCVPTY